MSSKQHFMVVAVAAMLLCSGRTHAFSVSKSSSGSRLSTTSRSVVQSINLHQPPMTSRRRRRTLISRKFCTTRSTLHASKDSNNSSGNFPTLPPNEFSRTLQPDRILLRNQNRDYNLDITATPEECQALAARFDLSDIAKLSASMVLRQEKLRGNSDGVEVEGSIMATVTQTCVRTNEDFSIDLEFPLYCIVRPAMPLAMLFSQENVPEDDRNHGYSSSNNSNHNGKGKSADNGRSERKGTSYRPQDLNMVDLDQLQKMLQDDMMDDEDILMEDEAIYPTDGLLDVGELVAQLFWLKLDPYPKKPGSSPIQTSISG